MLTEAENFNRVVCFNFALSKDLIPALIKLNCQNVFSEHNLTKLKCQI